LEEEKLLTKDIWAFQFQQDGKIFCEYHVDCHPFFFERYVIDENKQFGGNLSYTVFQKDHCPQLLLVMTSVFSKRIHSLQRHGTALKDNQFFIQRIMDTGL